MKASKPTFATEQHRSAHWRLLQLIVIHVYLSDTLRNIFLRGVTYHQRAEYIHTLLPQIKNNLINRA